MQKTSLCRFAAIALKERRSGVKKSGWQLCKGGPDAYEKYIAPAFGNAWAQDIIDRAGLRQGEKILDLGCGTGIVARCAYKSLGDSVHITGVDVNEIALEKAREISALNAATIEWKQADVTALPFSNDTFDVLLCQQGLQYFPDRSCALNEIHRVLVNKGRIVFSVWRSIEFSPFYYELQKILEAYVNPEAASILSSAYNLSDSVVLRTLLESARFKNIKIQPVNIQMRYSPLEEFLFGSFFASPFVNDILALEETKRKEMFQAIRKSIPDYLDGDSLAAPMGCYVVCATK